MTEFKYLGMTVTNQDYLWKRTKSRLNFGNVCYHSIQNIFSPHFPCKNMKIKIYKTVTLPAVLYRFETWSHPKERMHIEGFWE
jgi:hypothetical protein